MAGIRHLGEEYDKKPDLIKRQLMRGCVVTEKLDGTAFSAENFGGTLRFYKKDERNPISSIDRVMMRLYEEPISFFNPDMIPEGYRLCFEYFFDTCPVHVAYDHRPEPAGLCLTHAKKLTESGNASTVIDDVDELRTFAGKAGVSGPPVVHDGPMDAERVDALVGFSKGEVATSEVFEALASSPMLNESMDSFIEGFVVQEKSGSLSNTLFKVAHPEFARVAKERASNRDNGELFEAVIDDFCDFVMDSGLDRAGSPEGDAKPDRYVDLMCRLFNLFVAENGERIKDADIRDARFSDKEAFSVNRDLISNERTRELVDAHPSFEQMFRIFMGTFRKMRNRSAHIGRRRKESINEAVERVWKVVDSGRKRGMPTFYDLEKQS